MVVYSYTHPHLQLNPNESFKGTEDLMRKIMKYTNIRLYWEIFAKYKSDDQETLIKTSF
jgi:hypothetical protein